MHSTINIDTTIASAAQTFPSFARLCGAYFHQDWHEEHATTAAAARAFVRDAPADTVSLAVSDIDRLLGLPLDDAELGRVLREGFDCNYVAPIDERTNAQWLQELRGLLQETARD